MSKSKAELRAEKAAQVKAAQARRERNRRLLSIGGVVAAMVLIIGGAIAYSAWQQDRQQDEFESGATEEVHGDFGFEYGEEAAEHTVVIYEDFLCPHCGTLEHAAGERLTEHADAGAVRVIYRPVAILGEDSERALNAFKAVLEVDEQAAKLFHDALFADQAAGPWSNEELIALAVDSGVAETEVRDAIVGGIHSEWVEQATQAAADAGLQGTPTILLDGSIFNEGDSWEAIGENLVAAIEG